ncbi:MAG: type IV pilus modification protein PilV [Steroidobacter sp.]
MTIHSAKITHHCSVSATKGLSLVEILVTLVIISVGLLGAAALHLTSIKNGYDSSSRSRATWLANYIADRMRANESDAEQLNYNVAFSGPIAATANSTTTTDITEWKTQIKDLLGGNGDGSITVTQVGSDFVASVIIQWNERGPNGGTAANPTQLQVQFGI